MARDERKSRGVFSMALRVAATYLLVVATPGSGQSDCPWEWGGLKAWSSPSSWPSGSVPEDNQHVVIPSGQNILLDVQPASLGSLTIQKDASLVWGNLGGLEMRAGYILVDGQFHMGSTACRFEKAAYIKLTGLSNSSAYIMHVSSEVRKALMVREGGTLELHGQKKTSWTRLAQTMPRLKDLACTAIYNHSDKDNIISAERGKGLHVIVWNAQGIIVDFNVFSVYTELREFIDSVADGMVVGMHAFTGYGIGSRKYEKFHLDTLDRVVMDTLGGKLIARVNKGDAYSLLAVKGNPVSTVEYYKNDGRVDAEVEERYISLPNWETGLAFQVAKSARTVLDYFRVVPVDVAFPVLELADDVTGWNAGDLIVVASTDFDWQQAEVRQVINCPQCTRSQVRVNESFVYRHYGNFTYDVDERAEVGLLSRNIVIEGVMENDCYHNNGGERFRCQIFDMDTFGGQIKVTEGFANVHIEGLELYHMGQQGILGSYPLHYHMCDEVRGSWFRDNSIHHSFQRCVTIHGTDYAEVSGNVCFDHLGHGYFLEDSAEQNNVIQNNLGLGTRHGTTLMSDLTPEWCTKLYGKKFEVNCNELATFWITHPNNDLAHNAAAGGEGHGFMFVFAIQPLGPSYKVQQRLGKVKFMSARHTPIQRFYNNAAHSNRKSGLFFDSFLSTGKMADEYGVPENGVMQQEDYYEPMEPPGDPNGTRVWTTMERLTIYKNIQNNVWLKGGNINLTYSTFADAAEQSNSGGTTGFWTGTSTEYSVFVGRTDNLGEPSVWNQVTESGETLTMEFPGSVGKTPWNMLTGVDIYQGPMFVRHSFFHRFGTTYWNDAWEAVLGRRPVTYSGAVSFKKDSTYPTYSSQSTTNLTFGFCDNEDGMHRLVYGNGSVYEWYSSFDGPLNAFNKDTDGSLTGTPNTSIVTNRPFTTGPECLSRDDWGMAICPYRYIKVEILGEGGNLADSRKNQWSLVVRRDDAPADLFLQEGKQRREYLVRTGKSFLIDFNTTLQGAAFPHQVNVRAYGVDRQDTARVGICMPPDMREFDVTMEYPVVIRRNNFSRVYSLDELDADDNPNNLTIFHDTDNGILFFKVWSLLDRTNDTQLCTGGQCYMLKVELKDGTLNKIRSCLNVNVKPYPDTTNPPPKPQLPDPCSSLGTSKGIGATRYSEVSKIVHHDFHPPCGSPPRLPDRFPSVHKGCFVDSTQTFGLGSTLTKSMTVDWCTARCYWKKYHYAGLTKANTCKCGQSVIDTPDTRRIGSRECDLPCTGNASQECGNGERLSVWSSGFQQEL